MLGSNLRKMRQHKGWSQEELGYRINTTRQTISKWEKGYSVPDAGVLNELSLIFECSVSEILGHNIEAEKSVDTIENKLENLNIILARRNDRWGVFWRMLGKLVLILLVVSVLCLLITILFFSPIRFDKV